MDENGNISARQEGGNTISGEVQGDGSIKWQGGTLAVQWVVKQARIKDLQKRAERHKALYASADTRPDLSQ